MHKQNLAILFLLFCLLSLISCRNDKNKLVRDKINKALEIGENQPQEALHILHSIPLLENLNNNDFMLYQIAEVRATRNSTMPISSQQLRLITRAAKYFEEQKDTKNAALANYYTAVAAEKTNNTEKGFTYYLKAYPYAQTLNDSLLMGKIMYNLGIMYTEQKIYDSAYSCLQKAIPLLKSHPKFQVQANRTLALNLYLKEDYENALKYLNEGSKLLNDKKNINLYNETYGIILKSIQKYGQATYYLRKNLTDNNSLIERLRAALNLVDIYTLLHKTDSATYFVELAQPLLFKLNIITIDDNYLQLYGYKTFLNYSIEQGSKDNILKYVNLYLNKQKEIDNINTAEKLFAIDKKINIQQIEKANQDAKMRTYLYCILILVFLLTIIVYICIHRMKYFKTIGINDRINQIKLMRH